MIYITSDIHGCFDEFMKLLKKIKFKKDDTLYILGDVIDRGPKPIDCLLYIMAHPNMKLLMGNHDAFMLNYLDDLFERIHIQEEQKKLKKDPDYIKVPFLSKSILKRDFLSASENFRCWMQNGGSSSYEQLKTLSLEQQYEIYKYLSDLPFYYIVDDHLLVHAGIKYYNLPLEESLEKQSDSDLVWIREDFYLSEESTEDTFVHKIIFGHTPVKYILDDIEEAKYYDTLSKEDDVSKYSYEIKNGIVLFRNKIAIDGACAYGGVLNCIRLHDYKTYFIRSKY